MQSPSGPKVYPKYACVHAHGDAAADVNVVDGQRGATPAHLAAKGRHGEALKLVVAAGADVNPRPCWLSLFVHVIVCVTCPPCLWRVCGIFILREWRK